MYLQSACCQDQCSIKKGGGQGHLTVKAAAYSKKKVTISLASTSTISLMLLVIAAEKLKLFLLRGKLVG